MEKAVIVRGRLSDPQHVELDEPVTEIDGDVEVVLKSASAPRSGTTDIFDLIAGLRAGSRSKEDIDNQVHEERSTWGDR
ncbi:MAG: hypothetical protein HYX75_08860 [Acidobacteria bacterium]|nr:hypothetical protein [Acidobacteriota bacterium]